MTALSRLSMANRAVVALATVIAVVAGLAAAVGLRQELIPSLEIPVAAVVTTYPGASPDIVEREVTAPLESATGSVDGVVGTTSTSTSSFSVVTVELDYGSDISAAQQEIQQAVTRLSSLPVDASTQVITGSVDDLPVVQLSAAAGSDADDLVATLQDDVVPRLEGVAGVRDVTLSGVREDVVTIDVDPAALAGLGLGAQDVLGALEASGVVVPAGSLTEGDETLSVQVGERVGDVSTLRALPLLPQAPAAPPSPGAPPVVPAVVSLEDVADVRLATADPTSFARTNGQDSIGIAVTKTPAGNTVEVSEQVRELLPELEELLGDEAEIAVIFDQAPFIEQSVEDLTTEGLLGLTFAVVIILLFLASVRPTLVTAVSIPLSILITLIGLWATGNTLNILTLGALTVAVGRVVDDSIVVIENIERHMGLGEEKLPAILSGVREVAGAVTSSTIATVAVFLPIAIVGGQVGELFQPFAVTVALALLASLLVSLTIVPVLAYWFLRAPAPGDQPHAGAHAAPRQDRLQRAYLPVLRATLARPFLTLGAAVLVLLGTVGLAGQLQTDFLGDAGQNTLTVDQTLPAGTSLEATDEAVREVEDVVRDLPEVETYQVTVGSADATAAFLGGGGANSASFSITTELDAEPTELQEELRDLVAELDGVGDVTVSSDGSGFGSAGIEVLVQAEDDTALRQAAALVTEEVQELPGTTDVTNDLAEEIPTVQVSVDRDEAAAVGVSETQLGQLVATALRGIPAGTVALDGDPTEVTVTVSEPLTAVDDLRQLPVPTAAGVVALDDLADVEVVGQQTTITRVDGQRAATVSATPTGSDLGALTAELTALLDGLDLPEGATVEVGGVSADQEEAFADLGLALLAAVAIVYLVMVATFRSLLQPLILLVSVPFAATGAVALLLLTGIPLGVAALIGSLMLVGIVVTNAIVLIDLVNQYRARGLGVTESVVEGARLRLRPILMTALATIGALTPMAFGITGGSVFISQPLAVVVIGGLISSTLLTLVLVPVLYTLLEDATERRRARRAQKRSGTTAPDAPAAPAGPAAPVVPAAPAPHTTPATAIDLQPARRAEHVGGRQLERSREGAVVREAVLPTAVVGMLAAILVRVYRREGVAVAPRAAGSRFRRR